MKIGSSVLEKFWHAGHWKSANISRVWLPDPYDGVGTVLFSFGTEDVELLPTDDTWVLSVEEDDFDGVLLVQDARSKSTGTIKRSFFIKKWVIKILKDDPHNSINK